MNLAIDLDGTCGAFPHEFESICSKLVAGGDQVFILSGGGKTVTPTVIAEKRQFLTSLGFGVGSYTALVVVPKPYPAQKVQAMTEHGVKVLIDNDKKNCKAAAQAGFLALRLQNAKSK
ncbi:MAG: hypothetical protein ACRDWN_03210 [Acidimicrobiales bacterium]